MSSYEANGLNVHNTDQIADFSSSFVKDSSQRANVRQRHKLQSELGANHLFSGKGVTKVTPDSRYAKDINQDYGVVEIFTFERDPLTIGELQEHGAVKLLSAKPIRV